MNKSFKNTYRFGMLVFVSSTLFISLIFGALFRSCNSESIVNVNVMDDKKSIHDTLYMEKEITKVIRDTVRIPIKTEVVPQVKPLVKPQVKTQPKPEVLPKSDTASK